MSASVSLLSQTVPQAGTAVALATSHTPVAHFTVQAKSGNKGCVYVGDAAVSSQTGMKIGAPPTLFSDVTLPAFSLSSGDSTNLFDLALVYINADKDGDGVNVLYFVR